MVLASPSLVMVTVPLLAALARSTVSLLPPVVPKPGLSPLKLAAAVASNTLPLDELV